MNTNDVIKLFSRMIDNSKELIVGRCNNNPDEFKNEFEKEFNYLRGWVCCFFSKVYQGTDLTFEWALEFIHDRLYDSKYIIGGYVCLM